MVIFLDIFFTIIIPMHRSMKFFIRMFVTFLLLTEPASRKPNPAL